MILLSIASYGAQSSSPFAALEWVERVLLGPLGTSLAVIAVAWFGFEMLTGRMSPRRGGIMVLGCFIFFGAPQLAQSLMGLVRGSGGASLPATVQTIPNSPAPAPRNPPPYDPYAGAAVPDARK